MSTVYVKNLNMEKRDELADEIDRIKCNIEELVTEFENQIAVNWPSNLDHTKAYVIDHLRENLENANPYNTSMQTLIDELRCDQTDRNGDLVDVEPIEDFGEEWRDME